MLTAADLGTRLPASRLLRDAFSVACQQYGSGDEQEAVACLVAAARSGVSLEGTDRATKNVVDTPSSVEASLKTLTSFYETDDSTAADLLENAVSDLLPELCNACCVSPGAGRAARFLLGKFASTSHPRDVILLFLGELARSEAPRRLQDVLYG